LKGNIEAQDIVILNCKGQPRVFFEIKETNGLRFNPATIKKVKRDIQRLRQAKSWLKSNNVHLMMILFFRNKIFHQQGISPDIDREVNEYSKDYTYKLFMIYVM